MTDLRVDWCEAKAARYACEHWHYSGTYPTSKSNSLGVWEDGRFIGSIVFALGASPSLGKPYGLNIFECCELVRVALTVHAAPVSQMLVRAIRQMYARNPGLRLIVSFADPFHDHHGGIYQATNWVYTGTSDKATIWRLPDGTLADPRRFDGHGFNKAKHVPMGSELVRTPGKHRYLYPLDRKMRKQIEPLRKPYPKRVPCGGSVESDASGVQPEGAGATPAPRSEA